MKREKILCLFIDDYCRNRNKKENCLNCHILKEWNEKNLKGIKK